MRQRCLNQTHHVWHLYGGRGIKICEEWSSYQRFLLDMGERPEGKTLDRIDNNGNYEPGNCRWATPFEQAANKRNNKIFVVDGKQIHLSELARQSGIKIQTLSKRILAGWTVEQAISVPPIIGGANRPNPQPRGPKGYFITPQPHD